MQLNLKNIDQEQFNRSLALRTDLTSEEREHVKIINRNVVRVGNLHAVKTCMKLLSEKDREKARVAWYGTLMGVLVGTDVTTKDLLRVIPIAIETDTQEGRSCQRYRRDLKKFVPMLDGTPLHRISLSLLQQEPQWDRYIPNLLHSCLLYNKILAEGDSFLRPAFFEAKSTRHFRRIPSVIEKSSRSNALKSYLLDIYYSVTRTAKLAMIRYVLMEVPEEQQDVVRLHWYKVALEAIAPGVSLREMCQVAKGQSEELNRRISPLSPLADHMGKRNAEDLSLKDTEAANFTKHKWSHLIAVAQGYRDTIEGITPQINKEEDTMQENQDLLSGLRERLQENPEFSLDSITPYLEGDAQQNYGVKISPTTLPSTIFKNMLFGNYSQEFKIALITFFIVEAGFNDLEEAKTRVFGYIDQVDGFKKSTQNVFKRNFRKFAALFRNLQGMEQGTTESHIEVLEALSLAVPTCQRMYIEGFRFLFEAAVAERRSLRSQILKEIVAEEQRLQEEEAAAEQQELPLASVSTDAEEPATQVVQETVTEESVTEEVNQTLQGLHQTTINLPNGRTATLSLPKELSVADIVAIANRLAIEAPTDKPVNISVKPF